MHHFVRLCITVVFLPALLHADDGLPTKTLLPGGVADPVAKVGYVQHTDGGTAPFELKTGKTLWNLPAFGRLVALKGNLLVLALDSAANRIPMLFLDTQERPSAKRSHPIIFPDWVSVSNARG